MSYKAVVVYRLEAELEDNEYVTPLFAAALHKAANDQLNDFLRQDPPGMDLSVPDVTRVNVTWTREA